MKRKRKYLIVLLLVALLCLNACSLFMPPDQKFDGGELLDSEWLSEIKDKVFSSESVSVSDTEDITETVSETESEAESEIETETETESEAVTEDDSVALESKTEEAAVDTTESSTDGENTELSEATEGSSASETESENGEIVYWMEGGEVWHVSQSCRYIKNKSFTSGTVEEALAANKSRVCSACGK